MAVITVMYPHIEGEDFDEDYYTTKHVALVGEKWGSMGLKGARIVKGLSGGEPGSAPTYRIMTIVDFESVEAFGKAVEAHGAEIFGDIPNFTTIQPVVQISEEIGG